MAHDMGLWHRTIMQKQINRSHQHFFSIQTKMMLSVVTNGIIILKSYKTNKKTCSSVIFLHQKNLNTIHAIPNRYPKSS